MSRSAAKLLNIAGVFCCLLSAVFWILNIVKNADIQPVILLSFFVAGVVLIIISLAYYTER
jgi:hypothetical protein